ncbi:MAG: hypothetical protein IJT87_00205 [Ruminiclostridium sp.]|nr:hypothetical protein [Ruminiclostridium sp.]
MSAYREDVKFGKIGYSCILSPNLRVMNSDNYRIFTRICKNSKVISAGRVGISCFSSFEHRFTFEGVRFRAIFTPIYNGHILCRCYPEDCFLKNSYSDMYNSIYKIRYEAMDMIARLGSLLDEMHGDDADGSYIEAVSEQLLSAEKVFSDASGVMDIFDVSQKFEYVPIRDLLKSSDERLHSYSYTVGREVAIAADIECGVARINYMILEAAIFELVGIMYTLLGKGCKAVLNIKGRRYEPLVCTASIAYPDNVDEQALERRIRLVKCSFESISGKAYLYVKDGMFNIEASVPVSLSEHYERIAIGSPERVAGEPKGFDDILSPDDRKELILKSSSKEYTVPVSMMLANIIFEPICRELAS